MARTLICSKLDAPTRLFTVGEEYPVAPGFNDRLLRVADDLGHERQILLDTLAFIVGHKDRAPGDRRDVPQYAYFRFAHHTSEG